MQLCRCSFVCQGVQLYFAVKWYKGLRITRKHHCHHCQLSTHPSFVLQRLIRIYSLCLSGPQNNMNPRISLDQFRHLSNFKCVCSVLLPQHHSIKERALSLDRTHLKSFLHLSGTEESKIPTLLCTRAITHLRSNLGELFPLLIGG